MSTEASILSSAEATHVTNQWRWEDRTWPESLRNDSTALLREALRRAVDIRDHQICAVQPELSLRATFLVQVLIALCELDEVNTDNLWVEP